MTDLVQRLRGSDAGRREMLEAADEIERLQNVVRLTRESAVPRDEYELALGVIEQLRGERAQVVSADYLDEVERLRLALRIILQKDPRYVP